MNPAERMLRTVDRYQQSHSWLGFPIGVVRKFGDDRGGALAALIAYYGLFSLFPMLLLMVTLLGYFLGRNATFDERVLRSALVEFPIIGEQIQENLSSLDATGVGLVLGLGGLVWGGLGVTQAAQHAMSEVWNVPGVVRPNFVTRLGRGIAFLAMIGTGVVLSTVLSGVGSLGGRGFAFRAVNIVGAAIVNVIVYLLAFRVLTSKTIPTRDLVPGAVAAGLAWVALQALGGYLVAHQLRHASQVYGFFGVVLGLLSWLYLTAQLTIYAAELNVVRVRRLWPRSLLQPPLTEADKRALTHLAKQEERRPEETVDVEFEPGS